MLYELGLDRPITEDIALDIVATDSDARQLERAAEACYAFSSIRQVPDEWRRSAFIERDDGYCLHPSLRRYVQFSCQDLRAETPSCAFDLILCRNLAFTYFDEALQRQTLQHLHETLQPGGMLVIGVHETLPRDYVGFAARLRRLGVYRKQC